MGNKLSTKNKKLEKAIQARKLKVVKKWIRKGANPNGYSKKSNYSFLSMAITLREVALVELLLKKGANPNQKSWLQMGKDTIDSRIDSDSEYPIHIAAAHGNVKIMQALLNSEIDINKGQDHKQGTALHQAARFGHSKLAELLLENGADIIGIDTRLNIPLHIAATFGQVKVAEVLLRHGSPIDTLNLRNWTPLHYASSEGALSMVGLLLQHGAKQTADNTGHTPLGLAKTEEMIRLFLEHTVDNEHPDMNSTSVEGPPKPTRTFAHLIKTRERSQSEAAETTFSDSSEKKELVRFAKSYADFGKWRRLHKNDTGKEVAPSNLNHRRIRKTKSTPPGKSRRAEKNPTPEPSVMETSAIPNRSRSLYQAQSKKSSVKKQSYSMRHRKVKKCAKKRLSESNIEISTKPKRSKSTSALKSTVQYREQITSPNQQNPTTSESERVSVLPINKERHHWTETESRKNTNLIPASIGCLSRSLHNLAEIGNKRSEYLACDANHNVTTGKRVQRTKSDGRVQLKKHFKDSWADFQLTQIVSR